MSSNVSDSRIHAFDAVRACAMFLGIGLHAAIPYMDRPFAWAVTDPSRSPWVALGVYWIHLFRMPVFFLVAGYFARLLFVRLGPAGFIRHRLVRIGLPLLLAWLTIVPMVKALWVVGGLASHNQATLEVVGQWFRVAFSPRWFLQGLGLFHLWFLYYLLMLYAAALLARRVLGNVSRAAMLRRISSVMTSRWSAVLLALPMLPPMLTMRSWALDFVESSLMPSIAHLAIYGLFMLVGWAVHAQPGLLEVLRRRWRGHLLTGAVLLVFLLLMLAVGLSQPWWRLLWIRPIYFLVYSVSCWSFALASLGMALAWVSRYCRTVRYLADASYWLYLTHPPLVIGLSVLLVPVAWPWSLKLLFVLVVATGILLVAYQFLIRHTVVGRMLHGRVRLRVE